MTIGDADSGCDKDALKETVLEHEEILKNQEKKCWPLLGFSSSFAPDGRVVCDVCADGFVGPEDHVLEGYYLDDLKMD
ncbi:hypothetical protein L1987_09581 [Smallanthus sonchifolius]|uniref:Uncharacterized protein n=1 Tax=Smallanthus sonchifolius TaxID=185202 RepID=A0ACB9JNS9_9ASTR|nr:hypothetical protein L1987_09581 [Smallanthus sonchifolius]